MSGTDSEAVTVSADGITVRKTVDTEQFQTLAVVLELVSDRDELARVHLQDPIPPAVPMDDVGFHPEYGSEFWSIDDGSVTFERDLEPGEAFTTIYGIRDYSAADADELLEEPQVGLVDSGPDSLDDVVDEERSEVVREFLSGEADLPGLDQGAAVEPGAAASGASEAVEAASDAIDPSTEPAESAVGGTGPAGGAVDPNTGAETAATGGGDEEVTVPLTGGVVRVLIKELREGDIDPEDRRMLRDELLDIEDSTQARLAHLQQRVSDLEAYADAIEAFIDEEGTAETIIADLREDVSELGRTVRTTDDRVDDVVEDHESITDRLDGLADHVDDVEERLDDVTDDVETAVAQGDVLTDRVEDLEDDVGGVDRRVDDLGARIDRVSTDVDDVDGRTADLASQLADLRDELGSLRQDVRDDLATVEADLEEFEAFRDRLSSVFGGANQTIGEPTTEN